MAEDSGLKQGEDVAFHSTLEQLRHIPLQFRPMTTGPGSYFRLRTDTHIIRAWAVDVLVGDGFATTYHLVVESLETGERRDGFYFPTMAMHTSFPGNALLLEGEAAISEYLAAMLASKEVGVCLSGQDEYQEFAVTTSYTQPNGEVVAETFFASPALACRAGVITHHGLPCKHHGRCGCPGWHDLHVAGLDCEHLILAREAAVRVLEEVLR